jgi:hypothetical protein
MTGDDPFGQLWIFLVFVPHNGVEDVQGDSRLVRNGWNGLETNQLGLLPTRTRESFCHRLEAFFALDLPFAVVVLASAVVSARFAAVLAQSATASARFANAFARSAATIARFAGAPAWSAIAIARLTKTIARSAVAPARSSLVLESAGFQGFLAKNGLCSIERSANGCDK